MIPVSRIHDSTLMSFLDIEKPQHLLKLFNGLGDQGKASLFIRALGYETPVANDTYGHWEKDKVHDYFVQKSNTSVGDQGAGVHIDLTLDASKIDANGNYYVREGDIITFPNETQGIVTDITNTPGVSVVVRVLPNDITKTCGAVAGGTQLAITTGVSSEGSGFPDSAVSGLSYFDNEAQIIKEKVTGTGTQNVNESWLPIYNAAGAVQGYLIQGQEDMDYRMLAKADGAFWTGQRTDNTGNRANDPLTNKPYKTTQGVIPTIRANGHTYPYTVGAFSVDDFYAIDLLLEKEFVPTDIPIWFPQGTSLYHETEKEMKDFLDNTNVNYATQFTNDKLFKSDASMGVALNFGYVQMANRYFMFNKLGGFSNPSTFGAVGYDFNKMGFMIPIDTRKDPKTGGDIPSFGTRYRAMGHYNRRMITAQLGGIGAVDVPVNDIDQANLYEMMHMGYEFMGANRMVLLDPQ